MVKKWVYLVVIGCMLVPAAPVPAPAVPAFESDIQNLEAQLREVSGRERAAVLDRLVDLYDNRSPKEARAYSKLLAGEYEALGDAHGLARALYDWGNYDYYTGYYTRAIAVYTRMLEHCKKNNLPKWLGRANVLMGRVYYQQGFHDRALAYYETSLEIRRSINDTWGVSCALNNMGHLYADLGEYTRAVRLQFDSLRGYDRLGDQFGIGFSHENIGQTYFTLENYDKALEFFLKSYESYKEIDDRGFMGTALLNIGRCYRRVGEFDLALVHYEKAMEAARALNLGWIIPKAQVAMAAVYNDMGSHGRAVELGLSAEKRFMEIDDPKGLYQAWKQLALAFLGRKDPHRAGEIMGRRLALAQANNDRRVIADTCNAMAGMYTRVFNHGMALDMLEKGRRLAGELRSGRLMSDNMRQASVLYAAMGDHREGLISFRRYREIENGRASLSMKGRLKEMEAAYEQERQALKRQVGRLSWGLAAVAGALAVGAVFMGFRHYQRQLAQKTATNRALQMESKLKLFQARVNPHFLFNSLDSLIRLDRDRMDHDQTNGENGPDRLKSTLLRLANVYRNILAMPDLTEIPISRELSLVGDYLEMEKQISGGRISYDISLPPELESCPIIPLCILTLAENAVKHGVAPVKDGGRVEISVRPGTDGLEIRVRDNGAGFDTPSMGEGFGLYSVQKRLELHYKGLAAFNIESEKGKFTLATLKVPHAC